MLQAGLKPATAMLAPLRNTNLVDVHLYLISEFADELCVVVVCFNHFCLPASKVRRTLDKVWPERSLRQEHILWLQIHLSNHLIRHLRETQTHIIVLHILSSLQNSRELNAI